MQLSLLRRILFSTVRFQHWLALQTPRMPICACRCKILALSMALQIETAGQFRPCSTSMRCLIKIQWVCLGWTQVALLTKNLVNKFKSKGPWLTWVMDWILHLKIKVLAMTVLQQISLSTQSVPMMTVKGEYRLWWLTRTNKFLKMTYRWWLRCVDCELTS